MPTIQLLDAGFKEKVCCQLKETQQISKEGPRYLLAAFFVYMGKL